MRATRIVLSMALLLAPLACGEEQEVASIGPQSPQPVAPGVIRGPYVQAGTAFWVRLDQPIDTFYTSPGAPLSAKVAAPVQGWDGQVLVPTGALVRGTLASVGEGDAPIIRVQLQSIDTIRGTVPLHASIRSAQHYDWKGPPTPETITADVYPYDFEDYGTETSSSNTSVPGRPVEGRTLMQPREVHVPAGALLRLQLTEPLVLPGAQLAR
jgi:hypothetical protein